MHLCSKIQIFCNILVLGLIGIFVRIFQVRSIVAVNYCTNWETLSIFEQEVYYLAVLRKHL